jgi:hypothetical protein
MLESAVQARAATEQQPIATSGNLATAFKAVHTRITGTHVCVTVYFVTLKSVSQLFCSMF